VTGNAGCAINVTGNTSMTGSSSIDMETLNNNTAGVTSIFQTVDYTTTSSSTAIIDLGFQNYNGNEFRVSGNFSKSGSGNFYISSTQNGSGAITFNKAGTQTFSYTGTASDYSIYKVNAGSTLQMITGLVMGAQTIPYS